MIRIYEPRRASQSSAPLASGRRRCVVWHVGGGDMEARIPLLLKLREHGYEVAAAGFRSSGAFAERGIRFWEYPLSRRVAPLADIRARRRLQDLFSEHRPDIVHAFCTKPGILATLAARDAGVRGRVRTVTGLGHLFSSSSPAAMMLRPAYHYLQKKASGAATVTAFQNGDDRAYFLDHGLAAAGTDAIVPGSGIDVRLWRTRCPDPGRLERLRADLGAEGRPVVVMIARMLRQKGVLEYLEAARTVRRRGVEARFLLAGPLVPTLRRRSVGRRVIESYAGDVEYLGFRRDVPALLASADLFVLPTYYREGVPRVLLEAAATGIPSVTTDMPGCRDVVAHGRTGLLVPPRDAAALAKAIAELLDSGPTRAEMGYAALQDVAATFDLSRIAEAYDAIYDRVLRMTA